MKPEALCAVGSLNSTRLSAAIIATPRHTAYVSFRRHLEQPQYTTRIAKAIR